MVKARLDDSGKVRQNGIKERLKSSTGAVGGGY